MYRPLVSDSNLNVVGKADYASMADFWSEWSPA